MFAIENPYDKAMGGMSNAAGTYGKTMQNIPANQKPGPTVGGAVMSGAGGAMMGAEIGSMIAAGSAAGPWGAAIGAVVGIGSYLLS